MCGQRSSTVSPQPSTDVDKQKMLVCHTGAAQRADIRKWHRMNRNIKMQNGSFAVVPLVAATIYLWGVAVRKKAY